MQGFSFGEPSERTPLLRDDLASSASASMSPDKFGGSRWSVVTTPGAVPSRSAHAVQISKHLPTSEVLPDGHLHDWMEDTKWSTIGRERVIRNVGGTIYEAWYRVQGWVAVLIIGVLVGTIGAMIHISALWVHGLTRGVCVDAWYLPALYCEVWGYSSEPPNGFHHWPTVLGVSGTSFGNKLAAFLYVFMSCLLTLIASWLVVNLAPKAAGAGVPEIKTILGGAEINGFSTVTTGLVKWVALVFAVGGSLSIGKAAPLMHVAFNVGDCVASCFEKYRNSMGKRRELLTSATAAGVCVAFGAPLGGVLYAFEETSMFV